MPEVYWDNCGQVLFKQGKKGRGVFLIVLMAVLAPVLAICVPLIELIILFGFE